MRTVKRSSVKLNKAKFAAIEKIARAFAGDKRVHLDYYQEGLNFSAAGSYRSRRDELKKTDHHAATSLPVHASDLALKEAFETEVKYWSAIAADIHARISARPWTAEQKHYAFWLLYDAHRFSALIVGRAPIKEKINLTLAQRRQVQNYMRRRARRMMGRRPRVKTARSFVLDNTLYSVGRTLNGQVIAISSLEKGERIAIPLQGEGEIGGNIRIVLVPALRSVEVHVSFNLHAPVNPGEEIVALDAGLSEVFVDDEGNHYGVEHGETLRAVSEKWQKKGRKRNKLHALAAKYDQQGKKAKARHLRRRNLGQKKAKELKRRAKLTFENQINRATNEMLKKRQPKILIVEDLDFRGPAKSRKMSRWVSNWQRTTLKKRVEFKAAAAGCRRQQINPAYTSQTCPQCGYLDKANRKGDVFQCLKCGHRGDADQIAALNQKQRYFDPRITLYTPKETVKGILLKDYQARLEHQNASSPDEKLRMATVPGQTLERERRLSPSRHVNQSAKLRLANQQNQPR